MTRSRKFIGATGTAATAVVLAAGVALAALTPERSAPAIDDPPVTKVTAVDAEQARSFEIFRRARASGDVPSPDARRMLGEAGATGKNIDLARAFRSPNGTGWAIPGRGNICLAMPDPVDGFGLVCSTTAAAQHGGLVGIMGDPKRPNEHTVMVLAPDGADVTANLSDGTTQSLAPRGGVATAKLVGAKSVTVSLDGSSKTYEMPGSLPVHPTPEEKARLAANNG